MEFSFLAKVFVESISLLGDHLDYKSREIQTVSGQPQKCEIKFCVCLSSQYAPSNTLYVRCFLLLS